MVNCSVPFRTSPLLVLTLVGSTSMSCFSSSWRMYLAMVLALIPVYWLICFMRLNFCVGVSRFSGYAKGRDCSRPPHKNSIFHQVLVKPHQDACRLGADGRACRIDGAIIMAVNQLVAIGPGHGYLGPIGYAAAVTLCRQVAALVCYIVIVNVIYNFTLT